MVKPRRGQADAAAGLAGLPVHRLLSFVPLVIYLGLRGVQILKCLSNRSEPTLEIKNYLVTCMWKQSRNRSNMQGVCSDKGQKRHIVQLFPSWVGSFFVEKPVAEWNLF